MQGELGPETVVRKGHSLTERSYKNAALDGGSHGWPSLPVAAADQIVK